MIHKIDKIASTPRDVDPRGPRTGRFGLRLAVESALVAVILLGQWFVLVWSFKVLDERASLISLLQAGMPLQEVEMRLTEAGAHPGLRAPETWWEFGFPTRGLGVRVTAAKGRVTEVFAWDGSDEVLPRRGCDRPTLWWGCLVLAAILTFPFAVAVHMLVGRAFTGDPDAGAGYVFGVVFALAGCVFTWLFWMLGGVI